jgi:phosphatidylglycerol:prolipoprotein diacylglycerol transferase
VRPRLVDALDAVSGTTLFAWLIPSPAVMYALAMLAALVALRYRSRDVPGLEPYHALGVALWTMVGALIGARAFYLIEHLPETLAEPTRILDVSGATTSWGAYLGGAAGVSIYCMRHRLRWLLYADLVATTIGLAIAVGRWACFLNGDDFGTPSGMPWAVRFPHGSYPFAAQARANLISPLDDLSLPVHPVQLYLSASGVALFFLTTWFWRRHRHRPGATLCFFWLMHGLSRFPLEYFRGDHDQFVLGLPQAQAFCIVTGVAATLGLAFVMAQSAAEPTGALDGAGTIP